MIEEIQRLNKELTYSYITGFFDGEGSVGVYEKGKRINLSISITNTNIEILIKIKKIFGGKIEIKKKIENRKEVRILTIVNREQSKFFLEKILPYSTVKRQQIEYALKYLELTKSYHGGKSYSVQIPIEEQKIREFFINKLKEMKHTEYTEEELKIFDDEIKNIDKNKNQPSLLDY